MRYGSGEMQDEVEISTRPLRTRATKEENLPSGSTASLGQEWQFVEIMSFLEEHVSPKQTHSNEGADSQEQVAGAVPETTPDIMYEHDDLIEYAPEDSGSPSVAGCSTPGSHCSPDSPSVSCKRSRKDALQEDFRGVLGQVGSILQKKNKDEDEHEGFFMMLSNKFKYMSQSKVDEAKVSILSYLNEF